MYLYWKKSYWAEKPGAGGGLIDQSGGGAAEDLNARG